MRSIQLVVVLVSLGACGGNGGGGGGGDDAAISDAHTTDGTADPDAVSPTTIRLRIREQGGLGLGGYPVVFQQPDDSVIATVVTDSDGVAEAEVTGPTNVSLLGLGPNNVKVLYVYLGAKPGDFLDIGPATTPEAMALAGSVTLQVPAATGTVFATSRCGDGSGPGGATPTISVSGACTPTNFFVGNTTTGHFYTSLLTLTANQTVDLTGQTFRGTRSVDVAVSGATGVGTNCTLTTSVSDWGLPLVVDQIRSTTISGAGTAQQTYTIDDLPTVPVTTKLELAENNLSIQWVKRALPANVQFDWTQLGVPEVSAESYANGTLTWSEQGSGGEYAVARVTVRNGGVDRLEIHVAGAKTGTMLRMPVYPTANADYNPQSGDTTFIADVFVARSTGGWDHARPVVHRFDFEGSWDWLGVGEFVRSN